MCIEYLAGPPGLFRRGDPQLGVQSDRGSAETLRRAKRGDEAGHEVLRQTFGRRVPIALSLLLAPDERRESFRRAARDLDWGIFAGFGKAADRSPHSMLERMIVARPAAQNGDEGLSLPAVWGGPPGEIDSWTCGPRTYRSSSKLCPSDISTIAADLARWSPEALRDEYHREREHVSRVIDENLAVECLNLLQQFFLMSSESGAEVLLVWTYR
jgi:hypothetical protein